MGKWNPSPYAGTYAFDTSSLTQNWTRLHQSDCELPPKNAAVLKAWVLLHNGERQKAAEAGFKTRQRWHHGGQQGHLHLRQLPGKQGKIQARPAYGGGGAKG